MLVVSGDAENLVNRLRTLDAPLIFPGNLSDLSEVVHALMQLIGRQRPSSGLCSKACPAHAEGSNHATGGPIERNGAAKLA